MHEIYLDLLFFLNLWLEFLILRLTAKILHIRLRYVRVLFGSITASIGTCAMYLMPQLPYFVRFLLIHTVINVAVLWIVFGKSDVKRFGSMCIVFYMVSFLLGGFVEWICQTPFFIGERQINILQIIIISDLAYIILNGGYQMYQKWTLKKQSQYQAAIYYGEHEVTVTGFVDTGNSLFEPISQKPVCILDQKQAMELCYADAVHNFRLIPFSSLGKQRGVLRGFEAERMCLTNETETIEIKKPMIGVNEGKPLHMGVCHLILHPDLLR